MAIVQLGINVQIFEFYGFAKLHLRKMAFSAYMLYCQYTRGRKMILRESFLMPSIGGSIIHLGKYPGKLLSNDEMKAATFPLGKYTFIDVHGRSLF